MEKRLATGTGSIFLRCTRLSATHCHYSATSYGVLKPPHQTEHIIPFVIGLAQLVSNVGSINGYATSWRLTSTGFNMIECI